VTNRQIGWRLFWIALGVMCWMIAVYLVAQWFAP